MPRAETLPVIAYSETGAARALGLPVSRFREYVEQGILPPPARIGRDEVWPAEELRRVVRGEANGLEAVQW